MAVSLRDYDLTAGIRRLRDRVSRDRGLVFDPSGRTEFGMTKEIRSLAGVANALERIGWALVEALDKLSPAEGGVTSVDDLPADRPLVRALAILKGHPKHPGFGHIPFHQGRNLTATWMNSSLDAGPALDRLQARAWDLAALNRTIFEGACSVYGDLKVDADATPNEIQPGSQLSYYLTILRYLAIYDAVDAFASSTTRRNALVGEWWLIQPVSPRLNHRNLALELGLELAGFLPDTAVDKGRVVMACYERSPMKDESRAADLADSKFVAGWHKVTWRMTAPPLTDPTFDLVPELEGVTADSYGPYRHSSELPPWPGAR